MSEPPRERTCEVCKGPIVDGDLLIPLRLAKSRNSDHDPKRTLVERRGHAHLHCVSRTQVGGTHCTKCGAVLPGKIAMYASMGDTKAVYCGDCSTSVFMNRES